MVIEALLHAERDFGIKVEEPRAYRSLGLPPHLKATYRLFRSAFNGIPVLLMVNTGGAHLTPTLLKRHMETLQQRTQLQPVFTAHTLPPHGAARLTAAGVPFVLANRRLFLPFLSLSQRGKNGEDYRYRPKLTTCAQLLVLGRLLKRMPLTLTRREAAETLPYSPAAVTAAFDELEVRGWGHRERTAVRREQRFVWDKTGKELWRAAQSYLKNPCRREYGVARIPNGAVRCGGGCLSVPTAHPCEVALYYRREKLAAPERCPEDEAPVRLHVWSYPPTLFAEDGRPDRLSLYLSLRHSGDLAVRHANEVMLRETEW